MTKRQWQKRTSDIRRLVKYVDAGLSRSGQFTMYEQWIEDADGHEGAIYHLFNIRAGKIIAQLRVRDGLALVDLSESTPYKYTVLAAIRGRADINNIGVRRMNSGLQGLRNSLRARYTDVRESQSSRRDGNRIIARFHGSRGMADPRYIRRTNARQTGRSE